MSRAAVALGVGARFSTEGTLVRAGLEHVDGMHRLVSRFASRGLMLPKSRQELWRHVREYFVVEAGDGGVVGCGGLRIYTPELAEVVGLAVAEEVHGQGVGRRLVERLEAEARVMEIRRLFAMTLTEGFFRKLDFERVERATIPEKVEADCRGCFKRAVCREVAMMKRLGGGGT